MMITVIAFDLAGLAIVAAMFLAGSVWLISAAMLDSFKRIWR